MYLNVLNAFKICTHKYFLCPFKQVCKGRGVSHQRRQAQTKLQSEYIRWGISIISKVGLLLENFA